MAELDETTRAQPRRSGAAGAAATDNLAAEVAAAVERLPGDLVKCTRIGGNTYRCNWWAALAIRAAADRGGAGGLEITTMRVRQSRLLQARRTAAGGLAIEPLPDRQQ